jgi:hypothetical protein
MNRLRLIYLCALYGAIYFTANWLHPTMVSAQEVPTTLAIVPAIIERRVDPGHSGSFKISLYNKGSQSQPVKVYAQTFSTKGSEGQLTFGDAGNAAFAAGSWMQPEVDSLVVAPNDHQDVIIRYDVPIGAEPGGHYASIMFEQVLPTSDSPASRVQMAARLAGLVLMTVNGDIIEAGQLLGATPGSDCSAVVCGFKAPGYVDHGPVPFTFTFNNTGNIHVKPKGSITIKQFGRTVATLPVDDKIVLPHSQRTFTTTWTKRLLIGPYVADLHLNYGTKNYALNASTSFWAIPWQLILIAVLLLLAMAVVILMRKYHQVQRLVQEKQVRLRK